MDIGKAIGKRIKKLRKHLCLSQTELGLICGWENAASRIAHYEKGIRIPKISDLLKLSKALKKSPQWIAFGKE